MIEWVYSNLSSGGKTGLDLIYNTVAVAWILGCFSVQNMKNLNIIGNKFEKVQNK